MEGIPSPVPARRLGKGFATPPKQRAVQKGPEGTNPSIRWVLNTRDCEAEALSRCSARSKSCLCPGSGTNGYPRRPGRRSAPERTGRPSGASPKIERKLKPGKKPTWKPPQNQLESRSMQGISATKHHRISCGWFLGPLVYKPDRTPRNHETQENGALLVFMGARFTNKENPHIWVLCSEIGAFNNWCFPVDSR